ncbi:MAG: S41 family peptidase [Pseudomonadales bacterium]|nr:S41 family peptidase [Pseudomonadales bacterium]
MLAGIAASSAAQEAQLVSCVDRDLADIGLLSSSGKYKKQYQAVTKLFLKFDLVAKNDADILLAFSQCWDQFDSGQLANGQTVSGQVSDQKISGPLTDVHWQSGELAFVSTKARLVLKAGATKSLAGRAAKILRQLKLGPADKQFIQLYWYLWTESLLAATAEKYNYYVYSDQLEESALMFTGRSFAVGFKPKIISDAIYVDEIYDDKLVFNGLRSGMKINEIDSRDLKPTSNSSWWLQHRPFEYTLRTVAAGSEILIKGESIPRLVKSLNAQIWQQIAYIRLNYFSHRTGVELARFMRQIDDNVKGAVVDLRFNGGGAVSPDVVDYFLKPADLVLVHQPKGAEIQRLYGTLAYTGLPLVILQNRFSASMAEVFSAMLRDKDHIHLIGEASLGKAVGQTGYEINEGIAFLVESRYFYPDAVHSWDAIGVLPEISIMSSEDDNRLLVDRLFADEINLDDLVHLDLGFQQAVETLKE